MEEYTDSANFYLEDRKKTWQLQETKKPAIWIVNMATTGSNTEWKKLLEFYWIIN